MMGGYGSMMGWTWLFLALLILGIVLLVVLAVRFFSGGVNRGGTGGGQGPDTDRPATSAGAARRILDERYARGELSTEEYRDRLKVLGEES